MYPEPIAHITDRWRGELEFTRRGGRARVFVHARAPAHDRKTVEHEYEYEQEQEGSACRSGDAPVAGSVRGALAAMGMVARASDLHSSKAAIWRRGRRLHLLRRGRRSYDH